MKVYLIAIGGKGAKCIESLLYINSVSNFSITEHIDYELFFIDSDNTANYDNLKDSIKGYEVIKKEVDKIDRKKMNINPDLNLFYNSFRDNGKWAIAEDLNESFINLCKKRKNNTEHATEADLLQTLYEPGHIDMKFKKGFHGFPNVGTLVTKHFMKNENNKWNEFLNVIDNDEDENSQIVLLGSIFGGTGASGIPAVLDAIVDREIHLHKKVSVNMMLPYFDLPNPPEDTEEEIYGLKDIDLNSAFALDYYRSINKNILGDISFILVGQQDKDWISTYAEGNSDQDNKAMIAEMVSGFLIMHTIKANMISQRDDQGKMYFCSYKDDETNEYSLSFKSLPCNDDFVEKITVMRFLAMIFINELKEVFLRVGNNENDKIKYVFEQRLDDVDSDELKHIGNFFTNFYDWSKELNYINKEDININNIEKILFSNEVKNKKKSLYKFYVHKNNDESQEYEFPFDKFVNQYNKFIRDMNKTNILTLFLGTLLKGALPATFGIVDAMLQLGIIIIKEMRNGD